MMMLTPLVLCALTQQLDVAKEQLFTEWTTSSRVANVTFGLPTKKEIQSVVKQVERLRKEIVSSTGSDLTNSQRETDVPFMLAMLDGIAMEHVYGYAEQCNKHLSELVAGELKDIAASRYWRMKHRASSILGDKEGATKAKDAFWRQKNPNAEDVAIFILFDIQQAFDEEDFERARALYDKQALSITRKRTQYLRVPFAHGYARMAPTLEESLYGWFELADMLVEEGFDRWVVDEELAQWISRLPNPPYITTENKDQRIVSLALRREIAEELHANVEVALHKLMELARAGDGRAAEQILEQGDSEYTQEAVELIFAYPKNVQAPLDYWRLYAARLNITNHELIRATELLELVAIKDGEYGNSAKSLLKYIRGHKQISLKGAFGISSYNELPTSLVDNYSPIIIQDLLQQCVQACHSGENVKWNRGAIEQLLLQSDGVAASLRAEAFRLNEDIERAIPLFKKAIEVEGPSVQAIAGLADCTQDSEAMQRVANSTSPAAASSYWFWLSNLRLLQWYVEDGGDKATAIGKVNRLRKKDGSLGGIQFISKFNSIAN